MLPPCFDDSRKNVTSWGNRPAVLVMIPPHVSVPLQNNEPTSKGSGPIHPLPLTSTGGTCRILSQQLNETSVNREIGLVFVSLILSNVRRPQLSWVESSRVPTRISFKRGGEMEARAVRPYQGRRIAHFTVSDWFRKIALSLGHAV